MLIWLLLAVLLAFSAAVSASETALFGLTRRELHRFREPDRPWKRRVYRVMESPRRVLMTVLITNTAVNVAIFAISFVALRRFSAHPFLVGAGGVCVLLTVVIFGEMVPKSVTLAGRVRFAPAAAAGIAASQIVLAPVQWLLATLLVDPITRLLAPSSSVPDVVTTDELRLLVEQSAREGAIGSKENEMLQAIVALSDASVREVMTPRVDLQSIRILDGLEKARETMRTSGRRRLPVCGDSLDDIKGVLYARDLYLMWDRLSNRVMTGEASEPARQAGPTPIETLVKPIHFLPEQANLVQTIRYFREEGCRFAIVVDEHGGTAGLVSIQDLAERIVGDLPDSEPALTREYQGRARGPLTERITDDTYRLSGDLSVRVWAERFGAGEIDSPVDTVAGLILAKLGRLPRAGDSVRIRNLTLTVEAMRNRRIERVLLQRTANVE